MVVGDFSKHTECLIIGSGPGGYVAAIRAAQLGKSVTVVEKDAIGGTCLNVGCIPSKALIHVAKDYRHTKKENPYGLQFKDVSLDLSQAQTWKQEHVVKTLQRGVASLFKKHNIEFISGEAHFVNNHKVRVITEETGQTYEFDTCIIASGSRPVEIKGFPFGSRILNSTQALSLQHIPKSLAIIGGGYIGCELAGVYANLGTHVTIIESLPSILAQFSNDVVKVVEQEFKHNGCTIITHAQAKSAVETKTGVTLTYEVDSTSTTLDVEYLVVCVGRKPNTDTLGLEFTDVVVGERGLIEVNDQGKTSVNHIYAIGDVIKGPQLAHKASYEAKVVAGVIAGRSLGFDASVIPSVCFTSPEIAVVGLTLNDAKNQGIDAKKAQFPYGSNGRSLAMNQTLGFVRLIYEGNTKSILGAEIVGDHASELIGELTLAIETQLTLEDISLTIHAHPTLGEMIMDASEKGLGEPIHG